MYILVQKIYTLILIMCNLVLKIYPKVLNFKTNTHFSQNYRTKTLQLKITTKTSFIKTMKLLCTHTHTNQSMVAEFHVYMRIQQLNIKRISCTDIYPIQYSPYKHILEPKQYKLMPCLTVVSEKTWNKLFTNKTRFL